VDFVSLNDIWFAIMSKEVCGVWFSLWENFKKIWLYYFCLM
jgi:hypothetical protein